MKRRSKGKTDNHVLNLYDCEGNELPVGPSFTKIEEIQTYLDFVCVSPMWRKLNAPTKLFAVDWGMNDGSEARFPNEIWFCHRHWNVQSVLHEMAHFVHPKANHGPAFIRAYLDLVAYFMGQHFYDLYKSVFKRRGIKF